MNDAQPRPSESDGPATSERPERSRGARSAEDAPVLTRQIPPPIEMVTLLGPRDDVLHRLDLGLLGQRCHLAFEGGQLSFEPAMGIRQCLAR